MNTQKNVNHTKNRLEIRDMPYTIVQLWAIAKQYKQTTAVILGKRPSFEGVGREVIILIVRNSEPVTIFTRRETQTFDKRNFDVQTIAYFNGA